MQTLLNVPPAICALQITNLLPRRTSPTEGNHYWIWWLRLSSTAISTFSDQLVNLIGYDSAKLSIGDDSTRQSYYIAVADSNLASELMDLTEAWLAKQEPAQRVRLGA